MTDSSKAFQQKAGEVMSALVTSNNGSDNSIRLTPHDEKAYWERNVWVEVLPQENLDLESGMGTLITQPSTVDSQTAERVLMPSDAICLLQAWQTHLGSCREACDEGGKRIWDRIDAVLEKAQFLGAQAAQAPALEGGK